MELIVHDSLIRKHSCALFSGMKYDVPLDEHDKEWCWIHCADDYLINKDGRIYSFKSLKFLQPFIVNGYKTFTLSIDNKQKHKKLHRLLAEAFIPNSCAYPIVDHIDRNRLNNSIDNLRWVTYSVNNRNKQMAKRKYPNLPQGVYETNSKLKPYRAKIKFEGDMIHLGSYETIDQASNAYKSGYEELMKQFDKTT